MECIRISRTFESRRKRKWVMVRLSLTFLLVFGAYYARPQTYTSSAIFAHNDYVRPAPFHTAYKLRVGYIEADVFLAGNELFVAHHKSEVHPERTLRALYLEPLAKMIAENKGHAYQDATLTLTLMIDLKTEGVSTLKTLVNQIEKYPGIIACPSLHVMISGSVPDPATWKQYPGYISFDGRPNVVYTPDQLARVRMISTSFRDYVSWDGTGDIPAEAARVMTRLRDEAHAKGKIFRFWATPDTQNAWRELMRLKMDVVVTDDVSALARFLQSEN